MAIKINMETAARFKTHRIWHFIREAKKSNKLECDFYYPVSANAALIYEELFSVLIMLGFKVSPKPPETGFGTAVGRVRILNIAKGLFP